MSEEVEKLKNILKRAHISPFIPDANDRETVASMSKKLSFAERAELFINFLTYPGTVLYDAGGLLEAKIRIDDRHSNASESRPLAYIEFSDGYNSRVEVIDILESVRNDATLIGHPVILYAIHHWQQLLIWEKWSIDDSVQSKDDLNEWMGYEISGKYIESAKRNLEAIGKALLEGVKHQAISKESALALKIKKLKVESTDTYLYVAWERLNLKYIDQTHDLAERISDIENYLTRLPSENSSKLFMDYPAELQKYGEIDPVINISTVINFLKADGSKFVYSENDTCNKSLRPQRRIFINAFLKWYYQKEISTIDKYQKTANPEEIDKKPYTAGFFSSSSRPVNTFIFLTHLLSKSLEEFCEPIECSTDTVNSRRFSDLISQTKTK